MSVHAQQVADGATNSLSNVTNNIPGDVTVGTNGSFTLLELSDNVSLINSLRGVIGRNATAKSNEVRLTNPTARWQMGNTLYVGSNGGFSRLVISNGAKVISTFAGNSGILGQTTNSARNLAVVTGAGSLWSNTGTLNIGFSGAANQLVVSNGARVHSGDQCYVGLSSSSESNRVTVSGAGSIWSSAGGINLGLNGVGNRLSVRDGGGVRDADGYIGTGAGGFNLVEISGSGTSWTNTSELHVGSDSSLNQLTVNSGAVVFAGSLGVVGRASGASLNTVTVTDPGSMWVNGGELLVGRDGPSNKLFVSNGGTVTASNLFVGAQPTSLDNRLVVDGGTLRVTNAAGTGVLDVRRGTNVLSAGLMDVDRLIVTNNGWFEFLGGTLVTRGAFSGEMDVGGLGGGSAIWDVQPGPSNHFVNVLVVGYESSSNQMLISGGALLTNNSAAVIGFGAGANGNTATVTGPGSRWELRGSLAVGLDGSFNTLTVGAGGRVDVGGHGGLNAVVVGGSKSFNGVLNSFNQVLIHNGGTLSTEGSFIVGEFPTVSSRNLLHVTGGTLNAATLDVRSGTGRLDAGLIDVDHLVLTNTGFPAAFGNAGRITIPDSGPANPYPSTISVTGLLGVVTKVTVTLSNLSHTSLTDLDILLVGPAGQKVMLMSDVGGSFPISNVRLNFDDNAPILQPGQTVPGTYHPVDYSPGDSLPAPAPFGPYSVNLFSFSGTDPNGAWSLYIVDDMSPDHGSLEGWGVQITTDDDRFLGGLGVFELNGGTLRTADTVIANGLVFTVGDGANPATLELLGGTHRFANNLTVAANGSLVGAGTVDGTITVSPGGSLTPGAPIGNLAVLGSVILQGTVNLQIDKSGGVRINDQVTASGAIFYNGTLNVTDIGTDFLSAGDRFFLFDATPCVGAFTTLNLPPLAPGLSWRNNLSVDGSIEVIAAGGRPGIASILRSGTSIVFAGTNGTPGTNYTVLAATNVALPASNWTSIATRQFDAGGGFSFTNAIVPGIPRQFFRLRVP